MGNQIFALWLKMTEWETMEVGNKYTEKKELYIFSTIKNLFSFYCNV